MHRAQFKMKIYAIGKEVMLDALDEVDHKSFVLTYNMLHFAHVQYRIAPKTHVKRMRFTFIALGVVYISKNHTVTEGICL